MASFLYMCLCIRLLDGDCTVIGAREEESWVGVFGGNSWYRVVAWVWQDSTKEATSHVSLDPKKKSDSCIPTLNCGPDSLLTARTQTSFEILYVFAGVKASIWASTETWLPTSKTLMARLENNSVQFSLLLPKWNDIIIKQNSASWRDTTGDPEGTKVPLI